MPNQRIQNWTRQVLMKLASVAVSFTACKRSDIMTRNSSMHKFASIHQISHFLITVTCYPTSFTLSVPSSDRSRDEVQIRNGRHQRKWKEMKRILLTSKEEYPKKKIVSLMNPEFFGLQSCASWRTRSRARKGLKLGVGRLQEALHRSPHLRPKPKT